MASPPSGSRRELPVPSRRSIRDFHLQEKLGSGGFGIVILARKITEKSNSALKLIPIPKDSKEKMEKTLDEARRLSSIAPHQSIIRCIDFWQDSFSPEEHRKFVSTVKPRKDEVLNKFPENTKKLDILCIQMELCKGNLRNWLKGRKDFSFFDNINIFLQIARGIDHLHKHQLIHRDLKPGNILFDGKSAKLSDLGWAVDHTPGNYCHTGNAGASLYLAPEQQFGEYGRAVDLYALGLILFELFHPPAQINVGQAVTTLRFSQKLPEEVMKKFPEVCDLILKLITFEPEQRPNMEGILGYIEMYWKCMEEVVPDIQYKGITKLCASCDKSLIAHGVWYKCSVCKDYYLCDDCEDLSTMVHPAKHNFLRIINPARFKGEADEDEQDTKGCEHYKRNCIIQCPHQGCGKFFPCRHCHDENVKGHKLDRHSVNTIQCLLCKMTQFPNERCVLCNTAFSKYVCVKCNLYDDSEDAEKLIYHCHACGFCRRRADENTDYEHCDNCSMCHPSFKEVENIKLPFPEHKCERNAGLVPCSICGKSLHDSRDAACLLACKHYVHRTCLYQFPEEKIKEDLECPVCGNW